MKKLIFLCSLIIFVYAENVGNILWKVQLPKKVYDIHIVGAPTIDQDGVIYFGADEYLFAYYPNGILKWKVKLEESRQKYSPVIGKDGTIYINSHFDYIYAISKKGDILWKLKVNEFPDMQMSMGIGNDGTLYIGTSNIIHNLYAINPNGTIKWIFPFDDATRHSSPAIAQDGTIYIGCNDKKLYAINSDGTLKWQYKTADKIWSSPAIGKDGTIYIGSMDTYLYAINPDGSLKWKYKTNGPIYETSPVIAQDGTIYIGSEDGYLYAIDIEGRLRWKFKTDNWILSTPVIGKNGIIYVPSWDNYLYAINPNGSMKWKKFLKEFSFSHSSPTIDKNKILYIGTAYGTFYAIQVESTLAHTPWPKFKHDVYNTGFVKTLAYLDKLANRSFPLQGYFIHYGPGAYDWLYITANKSLVAKLEGLDAQGYFQWSILSRYITNVSVTQRANNDVRIQLQVKAGSPGYLQQMHAKEYRVDGFFFNFGSGAYDWVYLANNMHTLVKLEGIDTTGYFMWENIGDYFTGFDYHNAQFHIRSLK
ncbi:PQQ-binding-like beta-propeller repeat protein [Nitratiruptor tergarcus]|uniref:PQQ-like domain-containing protein n=1 Tax=Nitratiruptor tergarcus DSM 16512 TaxID=1069081 RepID=A0A1W1WQH3_9BACT|nr:PQQ-binding-like beta-propeller repeat protein [Nitratiruptor tergarcus]SMC08472.1 PQQ-like domain-containing protein [Nitratiruptor tergarcus DSM 16512]